MLHSREIIFSEIFIMSIQQADYLIASFKTHLKSYKKHKYKINFNLLLLAVI